MSIVNYISDLSKPECAPTLNGEYLEDLIPGYRTSSVDGRGSIENELTTVSIEKRDGEIYRWKRLKPRTVTIHYNISVDSLSVYHSSYNQLKSFAYNNENVKIIFNDESDKYLIGNIESISEESTDGSGSGIVSASGEIQIVCSDPCKYSVDEYTVESGSDGIVRFNYDGTYPVFPQIKVYVKADSNGFDSITITNQDEKILNFSNYYTSNETNTLRTYVRLMDYGTRTDNLKGNLVGLSGDLKSLFDLGKQNSDSTNNWFWHSPYGAVQQDGKIEYLIDGGSELIRPTSFNSSGKSAQLGSSIRWEIPALPMSKTWPTMFSLKWFMVLAPGASTTVSTEKKTDDVAADEKEKNSWSTQSSRSETATETKNVKTDTSIEISGGRKYTTTTTTTTVTKKNQVGGMYVGVEDEDGEQMCGFYAIKYHLSNSAGFPVYYYVGKGFSGKNMRYLGEWNPRWFNAKGKGGARWSMPYSMSSNDDVGSIQIESDENWRTGITDGELTGKKAKYIVVAFTSWPGYPFVELSGLESLSFGGYEDYVKTENVKHSGYFGTGDILEVDCSTTDVSLNGLPTEAVHSAYANDWEDFAIKPNSVASFQAMGLNTSDVDGASSLDISITYRKVYL